MHTQGQNDTPGGHSEQREDGDTPTQRQHPTRDAELRRYEDDEVVTAPWPPPPYDS